MQQFGSPEGTRQELKRAEFWNHAQELGISRWHKGDRVPRLGRRLLVGIAPSYSEPDVALAKEVVQRCGKRPNDLLIEFFDMLDVNDMADLENYVPGIGAAYQTPVVGLWNGGAVIESAHGFRGRQLLDRLLEE